MQPKAFLVRVWDEYASSMGDWIIECVCLSPEKAAEEQKKLAQNGCKTNIISVKLVL